MAVFSQKKKILIADTNADFRSGLSNALNNAGFDIINQASDGTDAVSVHNGGSSADSFTITFVMLYKKS